MKKIFHIIEPTTKKPPVISSFKFIFCFLSNKIQKKGHSLYNDLRKFNVINPQMKIYFE